LDSRLLGINELGLKILLQSYSTLETSFFSINLVSPWNFPSFQVDTIPPFPQSPRFCSKGPQFLGAWHARAAKLLSLRRALDVADAAQLQVAFQQWAEVFEEEKGHGFAMVFLSFLSKIDEMKNMNKHCGDFFVWFRKVS
jgi:hypothetical protein